jgi:CheY-like chemotaxis protein
MPQRVLVIEDDAAIRRGIVDALRFGGYEPLAEGDGEAGLLRRRRADVDLVLLDVVFRTAHSQLSQFPYLLHLPPHPYYIPPSLLLSSPLILP